MIEKSQINEDLPGLNSNMGSDVNNLEMNRTFSNNSNHQLAKSNMHRNETDISVMKIGQAYKKIGGTNSDESGTGGTNDNLTA